MITLPKTISNKAKYKFITYSHAIEEGVRTLKNVAERASSILNADSTLP